MNGVRRIRGGAPSCPRPTGTSSTPKAGRVPPSSSIHGSGGGFDQGELLARATLDERFHWIAPSRFGYLRSTFHDGATFDDQAHAYAWLLDHLGVEKVAVVALSHGGPSALLFAALHPERVSSLTLVSCGVAASQAPDQAKADRRGNALVTIFRRDWRYWAVARLFRRRLTRLIGADDAVVAGLAPDRRELVDRFIDCMNPVSPRAAGAAFDNQAAMPNERIAAIQAPTLVFHAKDDTLQLYRHAEFAEATIPGARLVAFERGGHVVMAVEQATIRELLQGHILEHVERGPAPGRQSSEAAHSSAALSSSMWNSLRRPPISHPNALAACSTQSTSVTRAHRCQSVRCANPRVMSCHSAPAVKRSNSAPISKTKRRRLPPSSASSMAGLSTSS